MNIAKKPEPTGSKDIREIIDTVMAATTDTIVSRLEQHHGTGGRLLNVERTAEYLGISESQVYSLVAENKLKSVRLDRRHRFDIRDLDKLIETSKN
jgi:excisionase family DNA binding protein